MNKILWTDCTPEWWEETGMAHGPKQTTSSVQLQELCGVWASFDLNPAEHMDTQWSTWKDLKTVLSACPVMSVLLEMFIKVAVEPEQSSPQSHWDGFDFRSTAKWWTQLYLSIWFLISSCSEDVDKGKVFDVRLFISTHSSGRTYHVATNIFTNSYLLFLMFWVLQGAFYIFFRESIALML